jgi:hypothetical protein
LFVAETSAVTPEAEPVPQVPVETCFTVSTIAKIIAIVVAVILILRKW